MTITRQRLALQLAIALWAAAAGAHAARAQDAPPHMAVEAVIGGEVRTASGTPLAHVRISLIGVGEMESDSSGAFRFGPLAPGTYFLRAVRVGARPVLKNITVGERDQVRVDVRFDVAVQELSAVVVRADSSSSPLADPTGFTRRRLQGQGVYVTGEEIARRGVVRTEQLFYGIPGVHVDTAGIVMINRGATNIREVLGKPDPRTDCVGVQVFVDGVAMPQPYDFNAVAPGSIRGVELYRGPAVTPSELRSDKTVCGTVAIWTR